MRMTSLLVLALAVDIARPVAIDAQAATPTDAFFDSDGVRIHYVVRGSGPPVLLVHGFSVSVPLNWQGPGIIDSLASRYTVIAPDLRGHGASDKPHDPSAYGTKFVEDLVRLLDHLQVQRVHVVGYSLGAVITLNLLVRHPDRVESAVMGGGGWRTPDMPVPAEIRGWAEQLPLVARGEKTMSEVLVGRDSAFVTPPMRALLDRNDPLALIAVMQGNTELFGITETQLRANTIPVLAIVGANDDLARPEVDKFASVKPRLEVVVLPGANHLTALGHPLFVQSIRQFLGSR
jgi:pimeloyl-ACP methyl ester carboxylesterase